MMTVVTHMRLREGAEPEWDAAMRERLANATGRKGFVSSQLLIPLDALNQRVIVGTWSTRADWEAWHDDEAFLAARQRLEELQEAPPDTAWYEVIQDVPLPGVGRAVDTAIARARDATRAVSQRMARR